jgi:probable rRNA maturation factor
MSTMEIDIIFDEGFEGCLDINWLQGIIEAALSAENTGDNVEMSLLITGQEKVHQLNRDFRGKDRPTDVLSFAMQDELPSGENEEDFSFVAPPDGIKHLGEVIISYPQAVIQAQEHGHSVKKEAAVLVIHGVLHLLGYDHIEDEEAEQMEARERVILASIGGEF